MSSVVTKFSGRYEKIPFIKNDFLITSVPQSLLHFGALEYSPSLLATLEKGTYVQHYNGK